MFYYRCCIIGKGPKNKGNSVRFSKKCLKEMFSQIRRSAERDPRIRKRKPGLGPFILGQ